MKHHPDCDCERLVCAGCKRDVDVTPQNSAGWRSCIDHIIKPEDPCPVCKVIELADKLLELQTKLERYEALIQPAVDEAVSKATRPEFRTLSDGRKKMDNGDIIEAPVYKTLDDFPG